MKRYLQNSFQSRFFRDVATVMTGTALAQILGFLLMPVISRLYGPGDFGVLGTFLALVTILSVGVTLQYHQALMLPGNEEDAFSLFGLSCTSSLSLSVVMIIVFYLLKIFVPEVLSQLDIPFLPLILGFVVMGKGINQTLFAWGTRKKKFKITAYSQICRSIGTFTFQLFCGLFQAGGLGLIAGNVVGDLSSSFVVWKSVVSKDWKRLSKKTFVLSHFKHQAVKYKDFPLFSTPQCVLNALSNGIPVLLLGHFYGLEVAGYYAFGIRILHVPMGLILNALRQVLFQRISEVSNLGGDLKKLYLKTSIGLGVVASGPTILGFLFAPQIFSFVFGSHWLIAGEYARWLVLWLAVAFCNVPSILIARVLRQQHILLMFELLIIVSRVGILLFSGSRFSAQNTVVFFSITGVVLNLFLIGLVALRVQKLCHQGEKRKENLNVEGNNLS